MPRRQATPCSALGQVDEHTIDMCKLQYGHTGPHEGKYHDLKWTERIRKEPRPQSHRLAGQPSPIHSLPPLPGEER